MEQTRLVLIVQSDQEEDCDSESPASHRTECNPSDEQPQRGSDVTNDRVDKSEVSRSQILLSCDSGTDSESFRQFQDVIGMEPNILDSILWYTSSTDVLHLSLTCQNMYVQCSWELRRRKASWRRSLLQARTSGRCEVFRHAVQLEQIMRIGQLLDSQYDCTEITRPVSMATLEGILKTRLRNKVQRGDIVSVSEAQSFCKLSMIAVEDPTANTTDTITTAEDIDSGDDDSSRLCFYQIVWRSPRGEAFHIFPKDVYSLAKTLGYRHYFAPYLSDNNRRQLPCYAILPDSSTAVQRWQKEQYHTSRKENNSQHTFLYMFPPQKLSLILELCPCQRESKDGGMELQERPPSVLPYRRFYTPEYECSGGHNVLWWV